MSKVVFVGNVPYNYGEEQLIDVFKSVGTVVGFRLVFDRDTGKPKGYGFCEFADHETALSAVRNLNNQDVGGRPLRIDLADSDPFLEGKTTVHGELIDSGWGSRGGGKGDDVPSFLKSLPPGQPLQPGVNALDSITQTLANTNPTQVVEVLAQMKAFVITHPEQARTLLVHNPQLAYALFQALVLNKIVDPAVLQRMLGNTGPATPTPAASVQALPSFVPPPAPAASQAAFYPQPQPQQSIQQPSFFGALPAQARAPPPTALTPSSSATPLDHLNIDPTQKAMLMQVLSLTPEQIHALAPSDRDTLLQLRRSFNL